MVEPPEVGLIGFRALSITDDGDVQVRCAVDARSL
jgi:hypothetical protein